MSKSLNDKMNELTEARRARILAEADRMERQYSQEEVILVCTAVADKVKW